MANNINNANTINNVNSINNINNLNHNFQNININNFNNLDTINNVMNNVLPITSNISNSHNTHINNQNNDISSQIYNYVFPTPLPSVTNGIPVSTLLSSLQSCVPAGSSTMLEESIVHLPQPLDKHIPSGTYYSAKDPIGGQHILIPVSFQLEQHQQLQQLHQI